MHIISNVGESIHVTYVYVLIYTHTATCPCTTDAPLIDSDTTSAGFIELCSGVTQSPCNCADSVCQV